MDNQNIPPSEQPVTQRRIHRDTDNLARRLTRAATTIPSIIDHLNEQRANITTLSAPGNGGGSKGGHSDPVLRTLTQLDAIDYHRRAINDQLHCVRVAIDLLEASCREALGHKPTITVNDTAPTCHHTGCDEMVSSYLRDDGTVGYRLTGSIGGLCDSHRAKAWRQTRA